MRIQKAIVDKGNALSETEIEKLKGFFNFNKDKRDLVYLVAPLIDVDLRGFNAYNIPEVFLNESGSLVYLKFTLLNTFNDHVVKLPNFKFNIPDLEMRVFEVPEKHSESMVKILRGEFTSIVGKEKEQIVKFSGLPFGKAALTLNNTSTILLALFKNSVLRTILAQYVGEPTSRLPKELISKIDPDSQVFIENYLKKIKDEL